MATVSQRSWKIPRQSTKRKAWGFTVMVNGKQIRSYKAGWSQDDAEKALAEIKLGITQLKPQVAGLTFGEAVSRYLGEKSRKKAIAEITRILQHWLSTFGADMLLSDITADRIAAWKAERMRAVSRQTKQLVSLASVNRPLTTLRALLRAAHREWQVLPSVPFIKTEREQHRLRWLTPEEAQRLLDACRESKSANLLDLVEFSLYTGLRQGEALRLTGDNVDRARGVILVAETKTDKPREVPLQQRGRRRAGPPQLRRGPGVRRSELQLHSQRVAVRREAGEDQQLPLPRPPAHLRLLGRSAGC